MAAQSVDLIKIENWQATGANVAIPQYEFTLTIYYTDLDGTKRQHGPQVYQYPNDIAAMPLAVRKEFANQMILAAARVALGIDTWEQYT